MISGQRDDADDHHEHRDLQPEDLGVGDRAEVRGQAVDRGAAADDVGQPGAVGQRAQRGDERWHVDCATRGTR